MIAKVSSFAAMDEDVGKNGTPSQEVNAFLFAEVGLESSGMTLTVLSMLSRQDLDPWDEASHLASLPQKVAIKRLTVRIAGMSGSVWPDAQAAIIAGRLIVLLPAHATAAARLSAKAFPPAAARQPKLARLDRLMHLYLALALLVTLLAGLTLHAVKTQTRVDSTPTQTATPPASPFRFR
jgi:hypothetical protein